MPRAEEAIVLVGGLGTRLRAEVVDLPKPLAPVAGRPFLAYVLDQFAGAGLRRVVLATGYLAEKVEAAIGRSWQGMDIAYSRESAPLGTGGAIALASALLRGDTAHVANGDTFLRFDQRALERRVYQLQAGIGMALARVDDARRYGSVEVRDGKVAAFRDTGGTGVGTINAGRYFLSGDALAALPRGQAFSFESHVLLPAASRGEVAALEETDGFIDIGIPADFRRAQALFGAHP